MSDNIIIIIIIIDIVVSSEIFLTGKFYKHNNMSHISGEQFCCGFQLIQWSAFVWKYEPPMIGSSSLRFWAS